MSELPANWYQRSALPWSAQPALAGTSHADVVVLGGGLTGLSTALELAQRGYQVSVLEAHQVGWGASGRSGGQLLFGYGCDQSKLTAQLGMEDSRRLFQWSVDGVELVRERIARHQIDCDLTPGHAHAAIKPRQVDELKSWQHDLQQHFGYEGLTLYSGAEMQTLIQSSRYRALLFDPRSAHLHPLNYTLGVGRAALAAGVRIHEHSPVCRIQQVGTDRVMLHTGQGQVQARFAVLAGNAWLGRLQPVLQQRIMPVGTYIAASAPLGQARAQALIGNRMAVADINFVLDYFRLSSDHRLLFGGRVSYSGLDPLALAPRMRSRMLKVFPQLADIAIDTVWGGMVDITMNRAPDWGRLSPNVYYAQGFSGHGMAATALAGRVLAEAIDGQSSRLDLYGRIHHRRFPGGPWMRTPALMLAMLWYRLKDLLP